MPYASRKRSRYARPIGRATGRGGYREWIKGIGSGIQKFGKIMVPEGTFRKLGGAMGAGGAAYLSGANPYATTAGGYAGGHLGQTIAKAVGFGKYSLNQNPAMTAVSEGQPIPTFRDLRFGTRICHREYIGDIVGTNSTAFSTQSYPVNPGLASTFPWLSQFANAYETYHVNAMMFQFVSTSSDVGASGVGMGTITLATEYDVADASYPTKRDMQNSQYAVSNKPSESFLHTIECDPVAEGNKKLFTRRLPINVTEDIRMYDKCILQVGQSGIPATDAALGELWVTYDITFYKPQLGSNSSGFSHFDLPAGVTTSNYLTDAVAGTLALASGDNFGSCTTSTFDFNDDFVSVGDKFLVQYSVRGATTTLTNSLGRTLVGTAVLPVFNQVGTDTDNMITPAGVSSTIQTITFALSITAFPASFAITSGTLPTGVTGGDLFLFKVNDIANI